MPTAPSSTSETSSSLPPPHPQNPLPIPAPPSPPPPKASVDSSPAPTVLAAGHHRVSSARDKAAVGSANSSSSSARHAAGTGSASHDIEMEPIHGHRRRKSSLMNPIGGAGQPGILPPGRPMAQTASLLEEPDEHLDGSGRMMGDSGGGSSKEGSGRDSFSDDDVHDDEEMGLTGRDRIRRQKKRRRNTLLDNRIAREKNLSPEEKKEADRSVVKNLFVNGALILLWYLFSLSISLYNKWMFDKDQLNFAFPLFTTSTHMLVQFGLSALVLTFVPSLRPKAAHNSDGGRSRHESEPQGSIMSKMFYLTRIGPCGAATSLDIGLGNTSLKFISLTFYTMCKSSSLAFVLLFAFVFRLETPTWRLVAIIATMTGGVILMVFGEVEFKLGGFVLVIAAAFFSGLRWALTQILLLRNPATSNPFSSIFFLSPVMFVVLLCLAIPVEGFGPLIEGLKTLVEQWGALWTPIFLLFPGCIAFLMIASEFALLKRTSVVTLSIAGIFKEVVTISAASVVFDDKLTPINLVGLLTTIAAIGAYNYVKITKMRQDAQNEVHDRLAGMNPATPVSHSGSGAEGENEDSSFEETAGLLQQQQQQPQQNAEADQGLVTADGDLQPDLSRPANS